MNASKTTTMAWPRIGGWLLISSLVACSSPARSLARWTASIENVKPPPASSCEGSECRAACERGDVAACTRLADVVYENDPDAARAVYESSCNKHDPVACWRMFEEAGSNLTAASRYARRACAAGGVVSCDFLSELSLLAFAAPRPNEDKAELYKLAEQSSSRACDLGSFRSCLNAVSLLQYSGGDQNAIASLAAKAMALAETDCADQRIGACSFVARWAFEAGDRARALEYYTRVCALEPRADSPVISPDGSGAPLPRSDLPESCQKVAELGGDPDAAAETRSTSDRPERSVPQVALEARRTSGRTQVLPSVAERSAIRAGKKSIVATFKICISARGGITLIRTLESSPYPDWNRRLFSAMRGWRYSPFTVDGEPVPVCTSITFVYKPNLQ